MKKKVAAPQTKKKAESQDAFLGIKILDAKGKVTKTEPVNAKIAESNTHPHLLYQVIHEHQANLRLGTAWVKDRSAVSGGGKKPWKQKGTGRARVGSNRSPIWRKGGITFGPNGREYAYHLPRGMKVAALKAGLKNKAKEGNLYLVDQFESSDGKTKGMVEWTGRVPLKKPLVVTDQSDKKTALSVRNLRFMSLKTARETGPVDVLSHDECVLTRNGYQKLLERF